MRRLVTAAFAAAALGATAAPTEAVARSCRPVHNVFEAARYAASDLFRIRADGVSCRRARRLAHRATFKALGIPAATGPILRFRVDGWRVTDDLRGDTDRLRARSSGRLVTWRFGELQRRVSRGPSAARRPCPSRPCSTTP
jgi:hypothetical protein